MKTTNDDDLNSREEICAFVRILSDEGFEGLVFGESDEQLELHLASCAICGPRAAALLSSGRDDLFDVSVVAAELSGAFGQMEEGQSVPAAPTVDARRRVEIDGPMGGRTRLRLAPKFGMSQPDLDSTIKLAAEDSPAAWPVSIDAELEDGEHVQLAFRPSGFGLAVTLGQDSPGSVIVTSDRLKREVFLNPGIAATFGTLFETRLTAGSSPEEVLRQLEAAKLWVRRQLV